MKLTFTIEAIVGMDPTRLGELIQDRVRKGATEISIEPLDSVIGRLTAMGGRAGQGPPPIEVADPWESALAYALARAALPSSAETAHDYAARLVPLVRESGYLEDAT